MRRILSSNLLRYPLSKTPITAARPVLGFGAPKDKLDKMEERAHAVAVAEWLNQEVLQHRIASLVIMADPRSLGEMRRRYHKQLQNVLLCDVDATMTGATPEAIIDKLRAVH
jgi:protein required for attachment to host cells